MSVQNRVELEVEKMEYLYEEVKKVFVGKNPRKSIERYVLIIDLQSNIIEFDKLLSYIRTVKKEEINLFIDTKGIYHIAFTDTYF